MANPYGTSIKYPQETDMGAAIFAIFVSIFIGSFVSIALALSGWKAEKEKARTRRLADAKMNARLLRFNL